MYPGWMGSGINDYDMDVELVCENGDYDGTVRAEVKEGVAVLVCPVCGLDEERDFNDY